MPLIYDLHCHTTFSDGMLSPEDLVTRAKTRNVDVLAVTDHDTVAGLQQAALAASHTSIDLVTGIEFSSQWMGRGIHIVGLNIDLQSGDLAAAVRSQHERRSERAEAIAARLAKAGIEGALDGAQAAAGSETLGRPHFARFLVESGYVANINQAFKKYLGAGKPGDIKNLWPEVPEVVEWIKRSGGVAVLAHPTKYKMTRTKLCQLTDCFAASGGAAIEVISGKQIAGVADNLARIANQFGLAVSLGSDFHVPDQPWQELGCCGYLPSHMSPVWELW